MKEEKERKRKGIKEGTLCHYMFFHPLFQDAAIHAPPRPASPLHIDESRTISMSLNSSLRLTIRRGKHIGGCQREGKNQGQGKC